MLYLQVLIILVQPIQVQTTDIEKEANVANIDYALSDIAENSGTLKNSDDSAY